MSQPTPISVYQFSSYPLIYLLFNFMSFGGSMFLANVLTMPVPHVMEVSVLPSSVVT